MRPSRAPLASLRVFEAVARHGSVSKAALELNVTSGAVSQQVRKLEQSLEVELFVRRQGRLLLSDGGRFLAERLASSFDQIERAVAQVAGNPGARRLRLRVMPTFAIRWLVPRLTTFYEQHPDFEIEVGTYPRHDEPSLEEVDFVVRHGPGNWADADAELIFGDAFAPVCSPAVAQTLSSPRDLAAHNLLYSMRREEGWELWLKEQNLAGLRPRRITKLPNAAVVYQAAIDGVGIALGQIAYIREDLESGRLVMPFDRVLHTNSGYYLCCAKRKSNQANIKLFRQWMRCVAAIPPAPFSAPPPARAY